MKCCTKCGIEKDEPAFSRRSKNGPRFNQCKVCVKAYQADHYQKSKQQYFDRNARYCKQVSLIISSLKQKPCADCEKSYPPWVMDFDHREEEIKDKDVSRLTGNSSLGIVLREIEKCDVVCANCHRQRTHARMLMAKCSHPLKGHKAQVQGHHSSANKRSIVHDDESGDSGSSHEIRRREVV